MPTSFTRADLEQSFPNLTPKVRAALEEIPTRLLANETTTSANVEATQGINNATVLTLSPNDAFANERVLAVGDGLQLQDNGAGSTLVVSMADPIKLNGSYRLTINLLADTNIDFPTSGRVLTSDDFPGPYADDPTAANAGVAVGAFYKKTGGTLAWRVA